MSNETYKVPVIVPNIGNTCYINSLLMGLFFEKSSCDYILTTNPEDNNGIYLQEYIKHYFIDRVRHFKSVDEDAIEQIRLLLYEMGWKKTNNELYLKQNVDEFYGFLMEKLNGTHIKIQCETITNNNKPHNDIGGETEIPFIPLLIPKDKNSVNIKDMLDIWMYDNAKTKKFRKNITIYNSKKECDVVELDIKNIMNIPQTIALNINRFNFIESNGEYECFRDNTDVYIQKKISLFKNKYDFNAKEWVFKSALCHRGNTLYDGHYYSLLIKNNEYYIFDDLKIPSLKKVSMDDNNITSIIKKECVFIIYSLY